MTRIKHRFHLFVRLDMPSEVWWALAKEIWGKLSRDEVTEDSELVSRISFCTNDENKRKDAIRKEKKKKKKKKMSTFHTEFERAWSSDWIFGESAWRSVSIIPTNQIDTRTISIDIKVTTHVSTSSISYQEEWVKIGAVLSCDIHKKYHRRQQKKKETTRERFLFFFFVPGGGENIKRDFQWREKSKIEEYDWQEKNKR